MTRPEIARSKGELVAELDNSNPTADKIPRLEGIDIHGELLPLRGISRADRKVQSET